MITKIVWDWINGQYDKKERIGEITIKDIMSLSDSINEYNNYVKN